jgi:hypothetical protein
MVTRGVFGKLFGKRYFWGGAAQCGVFSGGSGAKAQIFFCPLFHELKLVAIQAVANVLIQYLAFDSGGVALADGEGLSNAF